MSATKSNLPRPDAEHLSNLYTTLGLGCPDIGRLYPLVKIAALQDGLNQKVRTDLDAASADLLQSVINIVSEQTVRAGQYTATSADITTLYAAVAANGASITAEQTARSSADTAEASARTTLAARVTAAEGDIAANAASIVTEQGARAAADTRFDDQGCYTARVTGTEDSLEHEDASRIYMGPHPGFDYYHDFGSNAPVAMPPRPSEDHVFDYPTKQWIDPRTTADLWAAVRAHRAPLLAASDWTQLPDVPDTTRAAWASYRQALRDVTNQPDPAAIVWPTQPA